MSPAPLTDFVEIPRQFGVCEVTTKIAAAVVRDLISGEERNEVMNPRWKIPKAI